MKRRRALILTLSIVIALCTAFGVWLHVQKQQYDHNRALIAALNKNDFQTALVLVNAGADPNTRQDPTPAPTLTQLLRQLLHHTPPPANKSSTTLILACYANAKLRAGRYEPAVSAEAQLPLFRALLSHGANVNAREAVLGTALNYAVVYRNPPIVELLLQHGADANIPDRSGMTPLLLAASLGSTDMAHPLLAHDANPNVQDTAGNTALHYASFAPNAKYLIPELLAHGADLNLNDKRGTTPLQYAQMLKRPDLVRLLKGGAGR